MLNVRHATAPVTLSAHICPPEREDEPSFDEFVCDALMRAGFLPLRGFTITVDGPFLRVSLTAGPALTERLLLAWGALRSFDSALLDATTILVAWPGDLVAEEAA